MYLANVVQHGIVVINLHILKFYNNTLIYSDQFKYVNFYLLECSCENLVMPTCEVVRTHILIDLSYNLNQFIISLSLLFLNSS